MSAECLTFCSFNFQMFSSFVEVKRLHRAGTLQGTISKLSVFTVNGKIFKRFTFQCGFFTTKRFKKDCA